VKVETLVTNGNALVLATLLSTPATVGLIALLVKVRGYPARDYLALYWPTWRSVLIAFAGMAVLLVAIDLTSYLVGRPLVPLVMVEVYQTAWLPALLLAFIVLAPLGEETLFRGFFYHGIAVSRAGPIVAIIVSTVAFALMHVQYDWYGILGVAAIGLYLGVVRYRAGSLFLTMLLHAVGNLVATLELIVQQDWLK
jgi:membrane protease YdiL (CAAX protease family)